MSRIMRCNRCGGEQDIPEGSYQAVSQELVAWSRVAVSPCMRPENVQSDGPVFDLCEDCREIFLLQFMKGAAFDPRGGRPTRFSPIKEHTMTNQTAAFVPPSAEGLPPGALDSATDGASALDAWARDPHGRNFLAHALVQLARDGWLRTEPGEGFEVVRGRCAGCGCTPHLGLRCSSTGCNCLMSTDGENLTDAYSPQEPAEDEGYDREELVECSPLQGGCGGRMPRHALAEHMSKVHGISSIPPQARGDYDV